MILITGSSGCLGSKLKEHFPDALCPTHEELDIREPITLPDIDLVIHCAALKTLANRRELLKTNILGTLNVAEFCHQSYAKLVYISTDYVFKGDRGNYKVNDEVLPQNYYGESKLAGEYIVKSLPKWLIIRLSFSPDIYPYDTAFVDQITTRLPVSEAATKIAKLIKAESCGIYHVCGKRQSVYDYASSTKKVQPIQLTDHHLGRPKDTSLESNQLP